MIRFVLKHGLLLSYESGFLILAKMDEKKNAIMADFLLKWHSTCEILLLLLIETRDF